MKPWDMMANPSSLGFNFGCSGSIDVNHITCMVDTVQEYGIILHTTVRRQGFETRVQINFRGPWIRPSVAMHLTCLAQIEVYFIRVWTCIGSRSRFIPYLFWKKWICICYSESESKYTNGLQACGLRPDYFSNMWARGRVLVALGHGHGLSVWPLLTSN